MLKNWMLYLILLFPGGFASGQVVLDAPFIIKRHFLNHTGIEYYMDLMNDMAADTFPKPPMSSFLFSEPEYARVRVFRTVLIKDNPHLTDIIKYKYVVFSDSGTTVYTDVGKTVVINDTINYARNSHAPYFIREFIGVNIDTLKQDTLRYSRVLDKYKAIEKELNFYNFMGMLGSENGILVQKKNWMPYATVVSFKQILVSAFIQNPCRQFGMPYTSHDLIYPSYISDIVNRLFGSEKEEITGVRLMEDYYIDEYSGELRSMIIGIGLIGNDLRFGNELGWRYYPEFSREITNMHTMFNDTLTNYDYVLTEHLYKGSIDSIQQLGYSGCGKDECDNVFNVKLLPIVHLKLHRELHAGRFRNVNGILELPQESALPAMTVNYSDGLLHGNISATYPNGHEFYNGNMKNGRREGKFKFYYPSGRLMALRNFSNGFLEGPQKSYYENRQLYTDYEFKDGDIQWLKRYYNDGILISEGKFKYGLLHGKWTYKLKMDSLQFHQIQINNRKHVPLKYDGKVLEVPIIYTHEQNVSYPVHHGYLGEKTVFIRVEQE